MGVFDAAPKRRRRRRRRWQASARRLARLRVGRASALRGRRSALLARAFGDPAEIAIGKVRVAVPRTSLPWRFRRRRMSRQSFPSSASTAAAARWPGDTRRGGSRARRARLLPLGDRLPNVWSIASAAPRGGFDAVIGNPPYVRQELLGEEVKRALKAGYAAFDGMADLYVYFYEQALRLLSPGGRLSYVVTNKWLRAGYAEALAGRVRRARRTRVHRRLRPRQALSSRTPTSSPAWSWCVVPCRPKTPARAPRSASSRARTCRARVSPQL